ncbi:MAG: DHA1 family bicyclomycin/chloramphenicol resistance-like MFS transporter [Gammaproteobacteria bacterium]
MSSPPRLWVILSVIVAASAVSIMSTDLYTPSLPHLAGYFDTTPQAVKLTISANLLAYGAATLFVGPISDRYGRRPVMLVGLTLFTVFSMMCALALDIGQLIAFRIAQGVCASVEAVVGLAIIRDLFKETDQVRALAIWGTAIAVAPALAPIIGGYVHVSLGWQANFWIIAIIGVIVTVLAWRQLPESATVNLNALKPRAFIRGYRLLLRNRQFMSYVLMLGTSLGVIFAFITAAPFILIEQFSVPTHHYGYYQGAIVAAYFVGSLASTWLAGKVDASTLLYVGLAFAALGTIALPYVYFADLLTPVTLAGAVAVTAVGLGPIFAVAPSLALSTIDPAPITPAPVNLEPSLSGTTGDDSQSGAGTGSASALISAGEMLVCGLAATLVTVLHDGTAFGLIATTSILLFAGAGACLLGIGPANIIDRSDNKDFIP